jgi:hypothetical protein
MRRLIFVFVVPLLLSPSVRAAYAGRSTQPAQVQRVTVSSGLYFFAPGENFSRAACRDLAEDAFREQVRDFEIQCGTELRGRWTYGPTSVVVDRAEGACNMERSATCRFPSQRPGPE